MILLSNGNRQLESYKPIYFIKLSILLIPKAEIGKRGKLLNLASDELQELRSDSSKQNWALKGETNLYLFEECKGSSMPGHQYNLLHQ